MLQVTQPWSGELPSGGLGPAFALVLDEMESMAIELEGLLATVSETSETGENLEYDASFAALERALAGKAEQQIGSTIVPAEPPNWERVEGLATELLQRSKDLRLAVPLASALAVRRGFTGFADGCAVIRGLIDRYWTTLHPHLDPDDPRDATMRVTALAGLYEPRLLALLRGAPLVKSRSHGVLTWRNLQRSPGAAAADPATIDAAFNESGDQARELARALRDSIAHLGAVESAFAAVTTVPDLAPLTQFLRDVLGQIEPRIPAESAETAASASTDDGASTSPGPKRALSGEVRSRDDVLRAIDAICKYYATYEPSSPLPLLLGRCKRLATMSFIEILKEMLPDALTQVQLIAGKTDE